MNASSETLRIQYLHVVRGWNTPIRAFRRPPSARRPRWPRRRAPRTELATCRVTTTAPSNRYSTQWWWSEFHVPFAVVALARAGRLFSVNAWFCNTPDRSAAVERRLMAPQITVVHCATTVMALFVAFSFPQRKNALVTHLCGDRGRQLCHA